MIELSILSTPSSMQIVIEATVDSKQFLKTLLANSGIQVLAEPEKSGDERLRMSMPETIPNGLVLLEAIETNAEAFTGEVTLHDGRKFSLDSEGRTKLREVITNSMKQPQGVVQQPPPWTVFIPEIKAMIKEIIGLIHWYPRAVGEAQHAVARNFLIVIGLAVFGVGFLTYFGKVSGDAFVFVIGILLGYLFSFLSRYLGLSGGGD